MLKFTCWNSPVKIHLLNSDVKIYPVKIHKESKNSCIVSMPIEISIPHDKMPMQLYECVYNEGNVSVIW